MRGDLAVRINDGYTDRVVTAKVSGLKFRKTAPGGHADASCTINIPASDLPDLGPTDRLYISDARTGRVLFDGYTDTPGTMLGRNGEGFSISALGGQSRLNDKAQQLVYIDRTLNSWTQDTTHAQAPSGTAQNGTGPDGSGILEGTPAIYLQFNPGQPVDSNSQVGMLYTGLEGADMKIGGLVGSYDCGSNDTDYRIQWITRPVATLFPAAVFNTTGGSVGVFAGGDIDADQEMILFRLLRTGAATNVSLDNVWGATGFLSILGQLVDRYGVNIDAFSAVHFSGSDTWVFAHEVVEDLLGRALTFCDPATAVVETATYQIDQLAYVDGAKPMQVLDDLVSLEPDMVYLIGATGSNGLHQFEWRLWPTTPRYVIPASIPVNIPGGDIDLCNRIQVSWSWTDKDGTHSEVEIVTSTVPALDAVGRVRDADPVTLPAGRGSTANAERIGAQILAAKANPPRSGTCVVDQPILDLLTGAMASPWELEPGYLAQVAATGEMLRITETEYDDAACATTLTLGEPVLTDDQRIARLEKVVSP